MKGLYPVSVDLYAYLRGAEMGAPLAEEAEEVTAPLTPAVCRHHSEFGYAEPPLLEVSVGEADDLPLAAEEKKAASPLSSTSLTLFVIAVELPYLVAIGKSLRPPLA